MHTYEELRIIKSILDDRLELMAALQVKAEYVSMELVSSYIASHPELNANATTLFSMYFIMLSGRVSVSPDEIRPQLKKWPPAKAPANITTALQSLEKQGLIEVYPQGQKSFRLTSKGIARVTAPLFSSANKSEGTEVALDTEADSNTKLPTTND